MSWLHFGHHRACRTALAKQYTAVHARWLERAMHRSDTSDLRVPARRVDEGGFDSLICQPNGRKRCDQWWNDTFVYLDVIAP